MSASAIEDDSLVAQASEQRIVCSTYPGKVPEILSVPVGDTLVTKPMKHLAQKIDLNDIPMEEIVVLEPLALSVPDVSLDSRPMAGNMNRNLLEHVVLEEDRTSRPMDGAFGPELLGHSVLKVHLDSRHGRNELKPEPSEHPVHDSTPRRVVGFDDNQTVSDPLEHSRIGTSDDPVPKPAPLELAEHSTSVGHSGRQLKPEPSEHPVPDSTPHGVVGFSDNQTVSEPLEHLRTCIGDNLVPTPAPSELAEHSTSNGPGVTPEPQQAEDYCSGRDWFSGALVSHMMGPRGGN